MKRTPYLTPLSWEHHSALVNANRVKRGLAAQADLAVIQEFIEYIWEQDLRPHFNREENILLSRPEAKGIPEAIKTRTLQEHEEFNALFRQIQSSVTPDEKNTLFSRFAELLIAHVRFEESEFFPSVEEAFPEDVLEMVGQQLKEQHVPACFTWNPPFWEKPKTA